MNEDCEMHVKIGFGKYVCVLRVSSTLSLVKALKDEGNKMATKGALIYLSSVQARTLRLLHRMHRQGYSESTM